MSGLTLGDSAHIRAVDIIGGSFERSVAANKSQHGVCERADHCASARGAAGPLLSRTDVPVAVVSPLKSNVDPSGAVYPQAQGSVSCSRLLSSAAATAARLAESAGLLLLLSVVLLLSLLMLLSELCAAAAEIAAPIIAHAARTMAQRMAEQRKAREAVRRWTGRAGGGLAGNSGAQTQRVRCATFVRTKRSNPQSRARNDACAALASSAASRERCGISTFPHSSPVAAPGAIVGLTHTTVVCTRSDRHMRVGPREGSAESSMQRL